MIIYLFKMLSQIIIVYFDCQTHWTLSAINFGICARRPLWSHIHTVQYCKNKSAKVFVSNWHAGTGQISEQSKAFPQLFRYRIGVHNMHVHSSSSIIWSRITQNWIYHGGVLEPDYFGPCYPNLSKNPCVFILSDCQNMKHYQRSLITLFLN